VAGWAAEKKRGVCFGGTRKRPRKKQLRDAQKARVRFEEAMKS